MSPNKSFNEYIIKGKNAKIKLNYKGKIIWTVVDNNDLRKLIKLGYKWYASFRKNINGFYAQCNIYLDGKHKVIRLHNFILGYSGNFDIDHIDNNPLNNRRNNLRIVEKYKNSKNRKQRNINNTSGHRNVSLIKGWLRVQLQVNGKNHLFPEKFNNIEDAGRFANKMRRKYYRDHAGKD